MAKSASDCIVGPSVVSAHCTQFQDLTSIYKISELAEFSVRYLISPYTILLCPNSIKVAYDAPCPLGVL